MASRWVASAALLALVACGAPGADGEGSGAPILPPEGTNHSIGYACAGSGDMVCGCYEFCDAASGDTCQTGPYRGDFQQCGSAMSQCFAGNCCEDLYGCADDARACTHKGCAADGVTCTQVVYCPPRSACDSGNGVCGNGSGGAGDLCDYSAVYAGDEASCGASLWCFQGLCRPGCFIGGQYFDPGALRPGNPCNGCDPATSRIAWTEYADGTGCGSGKVCVAGGCADGCLIGGVLRTIGELNPANACQACAAASATGWTNTTAACPDDGDPCTRDRCDGAGACGHAPDPTCDAPSTGSMFGCGSAGGGGGLLALLLGAPLLRLARRRRAVTLLGALLLLSASGASAAPPAGPAAKPASKPAAKPAPAPSAPPVAPPARPLPAPAADGVAILTFKAGPELSEKTAEFVTQAFSAALHERGIATLSQEDVKAALGFEKQRQMLGCDTDACFAEIGGAVGVRRFVSGSLGRIGDALVVSAQLVDTRSTGVERRHSVRRPASRGDEAYLEAIPELVEELFPEREAAEPPRPFAIGLSGRGELRADAGGAGLLVARWSFARTLRASAGLLVAPQRVGAVAKLTWIPWNAGGRIYPLVAVEAMALKADPISPGAGVAVGVEWRATRRLDLALEVPVLRLTSVLEGMRTTYVFAAASAAWRF